MNKRVLSRGRVEAVNRILSPLLVAAMLLFLVAGAIALTRTSFGPQIAFAQAGSANLTVVIDSPAEGATVSVNQTFRVNATINNTGNGNATNVNATLIIVSGDATLMSPANYTIGNLSVAAPIEANWTVRCNGTGPVTITVNASGNDSAGVIPAGRIIPDTVNVTQQPLTISFTPATCQNYNVNQTFMVNVTVDNTGNATVNNVNVTITITGNVTTENETTKHTTPENITGGGNGTVSWTLTCTGAGDVNITVSATGADANTHLPVNATSVTHTVHQYEQEPGGLSGGAIAGIVLGSIAGAIFILFIMRSAMRRWTGRQ